jgi:hypothetical protein
LESKIKTKEIPSGIYDNQNKSDFYNWIGNLQSNLSTLQEKQQQITYQLKERIAFVPAPDKYVASLLVDAGDIEFCLKHKEKAFELYNKASQYDPSLTAIVNTRKNFSSLKLFYYCNKIIVFVVLAAILFLVGFLIWKKQKKF